MLGALSYTINVNFMQSCNPRSVCTISVHGITNVFSTTHYRNYRIHFHLDVFEKLYFGSNYLSVTPNILCCTFSILGLDRDIFFCSCLNSIVCFAIERNRVHTWAEFVETSLSFNGVSDTRLTSMLRGSTHALAAMRPVAARDAARAPVRPITEPHSRATFADWIARGVTCSAATNH